MPSASPPRAALTRRQLLALTAAAALPRCLRFEGSRPPPFPAVLPALTPWPEANQLLSAIAVPVFPTATWPVADAGARGDGRTDDTDAFQSAIAACSAAGGGHVTVPAGAWLVGALRLLSNVDLNLAAGATLLFSGDARRYPPVFTRYEGIECVNHSPLIYAYGESNLALTGSGVLDASRTVEWNTGSDREGLLEPLVAQGALPTRRIVTGKLRTSFVQPYRCNTVLIQGVTLVGAQFWQLHPTLCNDVTIDGVTTTVSGGNSDGCDPESCRRVVIKQCTLASGDDNLALKSGRDDDGRRVGVPCREIVVMNCQAEGRFGFITMGSELSGGIQDIYAFNNWSYGNGIGSALWIKSNRRRGGFATNINLDGLRAAGLRSAAVAVSMTYGGQDGDHPPVFDGIRLSHLDVARAPRVLDLDGLYDAPIRNVTLSNSTFTNIGDSDRIRGASQVALSDVTVNGRRVA